MIVEVVSVGVVVRRARYWVKKRWRTVRWAREYAGSRFINVFIRTRSCL